MIPSFHMGAKTLISVDEYLRTPYENPEPDFIDGEVVPRSMPNIFHSRAIRALMLAFIAQAGASLFSFPELRIRLGKRYRIADLALFDHEPESAVSELPPMIVIEVLSPDDSYAELMRRFADYASVGIRYIWLVDPITKQFSVYYPPRLTAAESLDVPEYGVSIRPADIWS